MKRWITFSRLLIGTCVVSFDCLHGNISVWQYLVSEMNRNMLIVLLVHSLTSMERSSDLTKK
jgi:hypothetical protein